MSSMLDFFSQFLGIIASFLMREPVIYFTSIFLGLCVLAIIRKLFHIR